MICFFLLFPFNDFTFNAKRIKKPESFLKTRKSQNENSHGRRHRWRNSMIIPCVVDRSDWFDFVDYDNNNSTHGGIVSFRVVNIVSCAHIALQVGSAIKINYNVTTWLCVYSLKGFRLLKRAVPLYVHTHCTQHRQQLYFLLLVLLSKQNKLFTKWLIETARKNARLRLKRPKDVYTESRYRLPWAVT